MGWNAEHPVLSESPMVAAFEVSDSGIGIAQDKQKIIFEAFQQADASTSRNMAERVSASPSAASSRIFGGEIGLQSTPGMGSTFTLYLPLDLWRTLDASPGQRWNAAPRLAPGTPTVVYERVAPPIPDDRLSIETGDQVMLIVEDDPNYARVIVDLAKRSGFQVLVASKGADAVTLAQEFQPTAVSLDVFLPDMLGWTVLSQLKQNASTRHIPVQIVTPTKTGSTGFRAVLLLRHQTRLGESIEASLAKIKDYAVPRRRRLLVIEDNAAERLSITALLENDDIEIVTAGTGAEGLDRPHRGALRLRCA